MSDIYWMYKEMKRLREENERLRAELAAKDAVVEAARVYENCYGSSSDWRRLCNALRALDKPCPTCGGSGTRRRPEWDVGSAACAELCPDCGGDDE